MSVILAIDQSTSATKAILFEVSGRVVDSVSVAHHQYYPRPGWVEHDVDEIYRNTLEAIRQVLARTDTSAREILALSLTNQRETIVVFERGSGRPLYRAIVWQCRRGDEICRTLAEAGYSPMVQQKTGLKIDTYFPASKLTWLFRHREDISRSGRAGEALIGTIDTYLIYRLTRGQVFATDYTNASRTLLYNIRELTWDGELCDLFEVPKHALPEVRESTALFGETDVEGILPAPVPICGVMGDSQAALFAQRCFGPGGAKVTLGTGSSVLLNVGGRIPVSDSGIVTTIGWRYHGETTYALEGIINFTGGTINWLRDQLGLITDPAETEALARSVSDNQGVYLVPAFVGLSAPYWRPEARAAILGLTPSSTRQHIVRAALESIAYRITDVMQLMTEEAGTPLQRLYADGGAARNAFLTQFIADMVRVTVRVSKVPDLSALGAAFSGALGRGRYGSLAELEALPLAVVDYEPTMDAVQARRYYDGWRAAVRRVL